MREIYYFIKGVIIGLSIAVPVGPIGILCIRRTLAKGRMVGFLSGLGAATADAFYGAIAGFGVTFLSNLLIGNQAGLRLIGGGLLCLIGVKTFLSKPAEEETLASGETGWGAYLSTFILTLTNPMTILFFAAVFAGLGVGSGDDHYLSAGILVSGVFVGSASWWLVLSAFTGFLRGMFNVHRRQWLNRISGLIIIGFGLFAFFSLLS
ncbi:MAG: LysE family translocator [Thermodesulfobacteriota bacterium]